MGLLLGYWVLVPGFSSELKRRAVFLDLNGTLVLPLKPDRLHDLTPIPGAAAALARLSSAGFVCALITVQSRIAKGLFTLEDFEAWFRRFAASLEPLGVVLVGPYVCPHRYADPCACKKPHTLLYERAAAEHGIDLPSSFVIGDSPEDMRAASRLGARGCLVRTGWAADPRVLEDCRADAAFVADSIVEAADWIVARGERPGSERGA